MRRPLLALLTACLVGAGALPFDASAYTGTLGAFMDGTSSATVNIGFVPARQLAGTLQLPSNATVVDAAVDLAPLSNVTTVTVDDNATTGFAAGQGSAGLARGPGGLTLATVGGSTEFAGTALDGGTFAATARTGSGVVLTGLTGSYTTPDIAFDGASYGRLIANISIPAGASATWEVVDPLNAVLQSALVPGDLITVDGAAAPTIRIRASLTAPTLALSPLIERVGAGHVLADYPGSASARRSTSGLSVFAGALELRQSLRNFTEYASNPIFQGAPGTWYVTGVEVGDGISVGNEIWLYARGYNATGAGNIGRLVSTDGGYSFTADAAPLLTPTVGAWDAGFVGWPSILYEGGSYKMWYTGASLSDLSSSSNVYATGYATSPDGLTWTKYAGNPVFSKSVSGWDDFGVEFPTVVKAGSTYFMYYGGRPTTDARISIGLATSSDGLSWSRYGASPVIAWGSTTYGAYDTSVADARYADGTFYLYWTCGASSSDYDSCLSTSTDGHTFTHFSQNPIVTNGDGPWDSLTAQMLVQVADPVSGHLVGFFTGYSGTIALSLARADPKRESPGSYRVQWDLAGEVPARLDAVRVPSDVPVGTLLSATLASSADDTTYSAPESVARNDTTLSTLPARFVRLDLAASATDLTRSPRIAATRLEYARFVASATFVSPMTATSTPAEEVTVTVASTAPPGTSIAIEVSGNNGVSWTTAFSGVPTTLSSPGTQFRYRLSLAGTSAAAPQVSRVVAALKLVGLPSDVRVETGGGALLASAPGDLTGPVHLALDPAPLNALIAPAASSLPPIAVYVDIFVNASSWGSLRLENLTVGLVFPDALRSFFAPDVDGVEVEEGASALFVVQASTSPGVGLTYAWWKDGAAEQEAGANYTFAAPFGSLGAHTVRASVSNGQFTHEKLWNVTVVQRPSALTVGFYPAAASLTLASGLTQAFYVVIGSASPPAVVAWTVDGAPAGAALTYNFTAPLDPGAHTVDVEVTAGADSLSKHWQVLVQPPPGVPLRPLLVTFAPGGDVQLPYNASATFLANLTDPADPPITFEWHIFGGLEGRADGGSFAVVGTVPGAYAVWVVVRNATGIATHFWNLTVMPPPAAPPVGGAGAEAAAGTSAAIAWVLLLVAAGAAVAFAAMYLRERARRPPA